MVVRGAVTKYAALSGTAAMPPMARRVFVNDMEVSFVDLVV